MKKGIVCVADKAFFEKRKKQAGIIPLNDKEIEELVNEALE